MSAPSIADVLACLRQAGAIINTARRECAHDRPSIVAALVGAVVSVAMEKEPDATLSIAIDMLELARAKLRSRANAASGVVPS